MSLDQRIDPVRNLGCTKNGYDFLQSSFAALHEFFSAYSSRVDNLQMNFDDVPELGHQAFVLLRV